MMLLVIWSSVLKHQLSRKWRLVIFENFADFVLAGVKHWAISHVSNRDHRFGLFARVQGFSEKFVCSLFIISASLVKWVIINTFAILERHVASSISSFINTRHSVPCRANMTHNIIVEG